MPDEVLEQLGGVATETPPATDGLGSQPAPPLESAPAPAAEKPLEQEAPPEAAAASESEESVSTEEKTEEPPSWAKFKTTDEVLNHEDFAVAKKGLEDTGYERGKSENRRLQSYLHTQQNLLKSIDDKAQSFQSAWQSLVDSGKSDVSGVSMDQVREINREYKPMFEALSGAHQDAARWDGIGSVIASLADAAKSEELGKEFAERVGQVRTGVIEEDASFYADLATALASSKTKPLENELVEAKAKIKRLQEEAKTLTRQGEEPPPGTPSGGSAGLSAYPKDEQEARNWHATGKWDNKQMRAYLRKQQES